MIYMRTVLGLLHGLLCGNSRRKIAPIANHSRLFDVAKIHHVYFRIKQFVSLLQDCFIRFQNNSEKVVTIIINERIK